MAKKSIGDLILQIKTSGEEETLRKLQRKIDNFGKKLSKKERLKELKTRKDRKNIEITRKRALSSLQQQTLAVNKLKTAYFQLGRAINTGMVAGLAATGYALRGIISSSLQVGKSFTQSLQAVKAIVGNVNPEELEALERVSRRLGQQTSFTASEVSKAMVLLARTSMKPEQILRATGAAVYFAGGAVTSLQSSVDLLTGSLKQFDLDADQAYSVTDVFSMALKESQFDMQSLTAAMRYGGSIGKSFGMTIEETVAALAQFRNLGLEGSTAGTQFRMAMSKASKETNLAKVALDKYNLSFKDINPQINSFRQIMVNVGKANMDMADIITVFGVRQAGSIARISQQIAEGGKDFDELLLKLRQATGTTKTLYNEMQDTVEKQLDIVASAAQEVQITIFKNIETPLKKFLMVVTEVLQTVALTSRFASAELSSRFGQAFKELEGALKTQQKEFAKLGYEISDLGVILVRSFAKSLPFILGSFRALIQIMRGLARVVKNVILVLESLASAFGFVMQSFNGLVSSITGTKEEIISLSDSIKQAVILITSFGIAVGTLSVVNRAIAALNLLKVTFIALTTATAGAAGAIGKFVAGMRALRSSTIFGVISTLALMVVTFVGLNKLVDNNTIALSNATDSVNSYMSAVDKLNKMQKIKFTEDSIKVQIDQLGILEETLANNIPKFREVNEVLSKSIKNSQKWTETTINLLNQEGVLLKVRGKGADFLLEAADAVEARLAVEKRLQELQKLRQTDEIIKEMELLEVVRSRLQKAEDEGQSSLREQAKAYKELNSILREFKTTNENVKESDLASSFKSLGEMLSFAIDKTTALDQATKDLLKTQAGSISNVAQFEGFQTLVQRQEDSFNTMLINMVARIKKAQIDFEAKTKTPTTPDKPIRKGKSQSQRLYEARLRLIERVMREERDLNATSIEGERNALADRLKVIREHYDKELKLHRRNAKKTNEILSSQYRVESVVVSNALSARVNKLKEFAHTSAKELEESRRTEKQIIENRHKEELASVEEQVNKIAAMQEIQREVRKKQKKKGFGGERGEGEIHDSTVTAPKQLASFEKMARVVADTQARNAKIAQHEAERLQHHEALNNLADAEEDHLEAALKVKAAHAALDKAKLKVADALAKKVDETTDNQTTASILANENLVRQAKEQREIALSQFEDAKRNLATKKNLLEESKRVVKIHDQEILESAGNYETKLNEILQREINKKKKLRESDFKFSKKTNEELSALGLTASQREVLQTEINLKRKQIIQKISAEAEANINAKYDREMLEFDKQTNAQILEMQADLTQKQMSLSDELQEAKKQAVESMKGRDAEYVKSVEQIYDRAIPQIVRDALVEQVDKYGEYSKNIRRLEVKAQEERYKTIEFNSKKTLGFEVGFLDFKFNLFANKEQNFANRRLQIEKNFAQQMLDLRKKETEFKTKFAGISEFDPDFLKARFDLELAEQEAVLQRNAALNEVTKDTVKSYIKSVQKIASVTMMVADTLMNAFNSILQGVLSIGNLALDTFQQLTGFSFNLSDGIRSVIDATKNEEAEQIRQGVVEGRLSEEMADDALAASVTNPKQAAAEYIDNLIDESVRFIEVFAEAAPVLLDRLAQRLPELTRKLANELPRLLENVKAILPNLTDTIVDVAFEFFDIIATNLPDIVTMLVTNLVQKLPDIIDALKESIGEVGRPLLDGVVESFEIIVKEVIKSLPDIIVAGIEILLKFIPVIVSLIVVELVSQIPKIGLLLGAGLAASLAVLLTSFIKSIAELFGLDTSGLDEQIDTINATMERAVDSELAGEGVLDGGNKLLGFQVKPADDEGSAQSAYSGIPYVPQTMLARLHQGEAVIPADVNARMHPQNPAMAGVGAMGARMPSGSSQPIDIAVIAEGKLLDAVQVLAMDRGHAPKMNKKFRRASGVNVGFTRGKYSKYSN